MQAFFSASAPNAIGPYAQAIRTGNLLYCSGQTPINPLTMQVEEEAIEGQTNRVIDNLKLVLQSAGLGLENVVKTNVFLTSMEYFGAMNKAYAEQFNGHHPARTTVAVQGLPFNALVEIACIAEFPAEPNTIQI